MPAQTFDTVPHVILVAHGAIANGEQWSCGLRTTKVDADVPQATLQTLATAAVAAWRTCVTNAVMQFGSGVSLAGVTARSLDSRGVTTTQAEGIPATAGAGSSSQVLPNQCAVVVSLKTQRAGRTGKGRIYLPLLALTLNGAGEIGATEQASVVGGTKTLIDSLNTALAALATAPRIGVQSHTASSQLGGSYTGAAVTSIAVGNIVDTQRRRRSSLTETYVAANIA